MRNTIYLLNGQTAVPVTAGKYQQEKDLQKIITDNPNILLREDNADTQLLLIQREQPMEDQADAGNAFSLDILFVDNHSIPTLVEVKRSTDTRIRREVTAQMLDYACRMKNADINDLRPMFCDNYGENAAVLEKYNNDEFWINVEKNLKAEHFRLIFAADTIPETLRILIEFLDRTMTEIEVYGVEIRPYMEGNSTQAHMLSVNVIGNSTFESKKPSVIAGLGREWTKEEFDHCMQERGQSNLIPSKDELLSFAEQMGLKIVYGRGAVHPTVTARLNGQVIFTVTSRMKEPKNVCYLALDLADLCKKLDNKFEIDELRQWFSEIPGKTEAEKEGWIWYPEQNQYLNLEALRDPENMEFIKKAIAGVVKEFQAK